MVSFQRWTITVERELDGIRIVKRLAGLTASEVMALKFEEQSYPGELVTFHRKPYVHGEINEDAVQSVDSHESVFELLRKSFTNELSTEKA